MTEVLPREFDWRSDRLFVHFDVEDHFLKLDTFIRTAESTRNIIAALDEAFFQGSLKYELIVLPPKDGSFLSKIAMTVSGGAAAVFAFLNTDVGAAYVEGLTGKPPTEWAQELGQNHRDLAQGTYEMLPALDKPMTYEMLLAALDPTTYNKLESDQAACRSSAKIVVALTRGVLERKSEELSKIGMEAGTLSHALDARAEFYAACINDGEVKGIGFTPDDDFPIPRNSFAERAKKPTRKEKEEEPLEWKVDIENIYVTSPNWDEEDQRTRQWKGKDQIRRDCYFLIDDAEFWRLVNRKDLPVEVLDNLKVQWAYLLTEGRPKNRRVLRVLEFNGVKLADPLTPDAIEAIVGILDAPHSEPSLFDGWG